MHKKMLPAIFSTMFLSYFRCTGNIFWEFLAVYYVYGSVIHGFIMIKKYNVNTAGHDIQI